MVGRRFRLQPIFHSYRAECPSKKSLHFRNRAIASAMQ